MKKMFSRTLLATVFACWAGGEIQAVTQWADNLTEDMQEHAKSLTSYIKGVSSDWRLNPLEGVEGAFKIIGRPTLEKEEIKSESMSPNILAQDIISETEEALNSLNIAIHDGAQTMSFEVYSEKDTLKVFSNPIQAPDLFYLREHFFWMDSSLQQNPAVLKVALFQGENSVAEKSAEIFKVFKNLANQQEIKIARISSEIPNLETEELIAIRPLLKQMKDFLLPSSEEETAEEETPDVAQ